MSNQSTEQTILIFQKIIERESKTSTYKFALLRALIDLISAQFSDSNDASIPDLALLFSGQQKLLIEVKFWAKLTKNQPLTYLQKLNQQKGECLFFLVPQQRIPILKNEIIQKMELEVGGKIAYEFSGNNIIFNDFASIGLLSWEELMGFLIERIDYTEPHLKADLDQLQQMILKMLSPDFLPFEVGDFDFNAYRKYTQMIELIDATVDANPNYNTKNLSYGGGRNSFQRWFLIRDYYTAGLELHARYWEEHAHPIWLVLYGSTWQNKGKVPFPEMPQFEANLKAAGLDYLVINENNYRKLVFPITIPFGQDKETCLLNIQMQLDFICACLPEKN